MKDNMTITNLMMMSHDKLEKLLDRLQASMQRDFKLTSELFDEFKWEFEKHIFTEEKAIFKFFNFSKDEDHFDIVPNLIKEHDVLLAMLNEAENDLAIKDNINVSEFKNLLIKHKNFEEKTIYSQLDQELNDSQKNSILIKINDSFHNLN